MPPRSGGDPDALTEQRVKVQEALHDRFKREAGELTCPGGRTVRAVATNDGFRLVCEAEERCSDGPPSPVRCT